MNTTFWSSVWLSVAIGVFVGHQITQEQIEDSGAKPEAKALEDQPTFKTPEKREATNVEVATSNAPVTITVGSESEADEPATQQGGARTAVEMHQEVVAAQHVGGGDPSRDPQPNS